MPRIDIRSWIEQAFDPSNAAVFDAKLKYSNVVKGSQADRTTGMREAVNDLVKFVIIEYILVKPVAYLWAQVSEWDDNSNILPVAYLWATGKTHEYRAKGESIETLTSGVWMRWQLRKRDDVWSERKVANTWWMGMTFCIYTVCSIRPTCSLSLSVLLYRANSGSFIVQLLVVPY